MATISAAYAPDMNAPHESRALVRGFLEQQGADDLSNVGELIVSELVSNVVRHAHSPIHVELGWEADTLRVEVQDGSSILPAVAELGNEDGGFGLRIVESFAQEWGVRPLENGKAVWCSVRRGGPDR